MQYVVYGYYSSADYGRHGEYIDEFSSLEDAQDCVNDFEKVSGRVAWIEEE